MKMIRRTINVENNNFIAQKINPNYIKYNHKLRKGRLCEIIIDTIIHVSNDE